MQFIELLIRQLWEERQEFLDRDTLRSTSRTVSLGKFEKSDW